MPYTVYVIELDPKVLRSRRFRSRNPDHREGKPCVYVGCTAKTAEERFAEHNADIRANSFAHKFGIRLRPRLYKNFQGFRTRKEAEKAEKRRTESLRKRGYAVWCG